MAVLPGSLVTVNGTGATTCIADIAQQDLTEQTDTKPRAFGPVTFTGVADVCSAASLIHA